MLSQLTQLKDTGIHIEKLPDDATDVRIRFGRFVTYRRKNSSFVIKYNDEYTPIGFIAPDNISFDPASYLESGHFQMDEYWRDYTIKEGGNLGCYTSQESFYTLLNSCGIEIDNKLHLALIKQKIKVWKTLNNPFKLWHHK